MLRFFSRITAALGALFWILLMLGFTDPGITVITILSALIHECGHVAALLFFTNGDSSLPRAVSSGFRIKTYGTLSYKNEMLVCLAGPLCNLLLFPIFIFLWPDFAIINLATALSNLMPLPEYDGHKILSDLLSLRLGSEMSDRIMPNVSLIFSSLSLFLSLFLILKLNGGYWIFFVFFIVTVRQTAILQNQAKKEIK